MANFSYCAVSDEVLSPLLDSPFLRSLSLFGCKGLTGEMFAQESPIRAPLESLDLSWVLTLQSDGIRGIGRLGTLKRLMLSGCEQVTGAMLQIFCRSSLKKSMRYLSLSYCTVKNNDLDALVGALTKLETLVLAEQSGNLWSTGQFTGRGVVELQKRFPRLKVIFST